MLDVDFALKRFLILIDTKLFIITIFLFSESFLCTLYTNINLFVFNTTTVLLSYLKCS